MKDEKKKSRRSDRQYKPAATHPWRKGAARTAKAPWVGAGLRYGSLRSPRSPAPTQNVTFLSCHTL